MKARRPQQAIRLEPPRDTNGNVTPVKGRMSMLPSTLRHIWKIRSEEAALEPMTVKLLLARPANTNA